MPVMALRGTLAWKTGMAPFLRPPPLLPIGFMPPPNGYCCCIGKPPPPPPNPPIEAKGSALAFYIMPIGWWLCPAVIGFGMKPPPTPPWP